MCVSGRLFRLIAERQTRFVIVTAKCMCCGVDGWMDFEVGKPQMGGCGAYLPNVAMVALHPTLQIVRKELQARFMGSLNNELVGALKRHV